MKPSGALIVVILALCSGVAWWRARDDKSFDLGSPFSIDSVQLDMQSEHVKRLLGQPKRKWQCLKMEYGETSFVWQYRDHSLKLFGDRWVRGIKGATLEQGQRSLKLGDSLENAVNLFKTLDEFGDKYRKVDCVYSAQGGVWGAKLKPARIVLEVKAEKIQSIYLIAPDCSIEELDKARNQ